VQSEAWRIALEKYGAATGLTVAVYENPMVLVLGPIHPSMLFEAVNVGHDLPAMFAECVHACLSERKVPAVLEHEGVAVIGAPLTIDDERIGTVVAGYSLTAFPEEATVRRFIRRHDRSEAWVWAAMRRQAPAIRRRLEVYAELLGTLVETLLSENVRARQLQQTAARLAEEGHAKDEFLAMLSHELRNPLAPMRIALQIITMRESEDAPTRQAQVVAERQLSHLTRLLDDLFDVSRRTRGLVQLRKEPVNLEAAVANALGRSVGAQSRSAVMRFPYRCLSSRRLSRRTRCG